jgi:hypothetical protein
MAFAILQEQEGRQHWVRKNGPYAETFTTAFPTIRPPTAGLLYADRETAERDAEGFRQQNARDVEATKRTSKNKTVPATYSVVPIE